MDTGTEIRRFVRDYPHLRGLTLAPYLIASLVTCVVRGLGILPPARGIDSATLAVWAIGIAGALLGRRYYRRRFGVVRRDPQYQPEPLVMRVVVGLAASMVFVGIVLQFVYAPGRRWPIEPMQIGIAAFGIVLGTMTGRIRWHWLVAAAGIALAGFAADGFAQPLKQNVFFGTCFASLLVASIGDHLTLVRRFEEVRVLSSIGGGVRA
jgi:hypothetical protein